MIEIADEYKKSLKNITFIDLFAGIGGFRLALNSFAAKCVFTSEWDKQAQEIYLNNFKEFPKGDITKISEADIPVHDILCGGFPCQSFSISGKQKGFDDTRGTLFFDVIRIAKYHKPKLLFLENVRNLEAHNNGETLNTILRTLYDIGYNVFYKVLNASLFGVPQKRERIYFIAFRKDLGVKNFSFPLPTKKNIKLKDIILPDSETENYIINRNDIKINTNKVIIPNIFGEFPLEPIRIGTVNKGGQGERIYHENGHSITLSAYGGGVGAKTGLYLINEKIRKLAPREACRLSGFPDDFILHRSVSQACKQFGNSVVVDVLQYILLEVVKMGVLNSNGKDKLSRSRVYNSKEWVLK